MRAKPRQLVRAFSVACAIVATACAPAAPAPMPSSAATTAAASPATTPSQAPIAAPPSSATDVLAQGRAPLDVCYERARQARPDLRRTTVTITFTLDDDGKPMTVALEYKNRVDEAAKECMRTAALALQFPATLRGKQTGVIEFTPRQ